MNEQDLKEILDREPEDGPPFQLRPGRYFLGVWFFNLVPALTRFNKGGDMNFFVWRKDEDPRQWWLLYRFRYYKDDRVWDGDDERVWKMMNFKGDEAQVLKQTHALLTILHSMGGEGKLEFLDVRGDMDRFLQAVQEQKPPWIHMQQQHRA